MNPKHYEKEAYQVFQNALQIAPNNPQNDLVYFNLGAIHQNQGQIDSAIQAYQQAVEQKTDIIDVYKNLGELLLSREKWSEAIVALNQAAKRDTTDAQIWEGLAQAFEQAGQKQKAAIAYQKAKRASSMP